MKTFYEVFIVNDRWKLYLQGLGNSLVIALFGFLISFSVGIIISSFLYYSSFNKKLKVLSKVLNFCINIVRAVPLLLWLLLGYFVVFIFIDKALIVATLIFGFNSSAYMCEILRGGLESVGKGQYNACLSIGLSHFKSFTKIILPQAIKNSLPSICNELITVLKMTSLVGWISIIDLTQAANIISTNTFNYFLPLIIVAFIYIFLVALINIIFKMIEKRIKWGLK